MSTPYGALHQRLRVSEAFEVEYQHPAAMFYHLCQTSARMSALVARAAAAKPSTLSRPWSVVLYADEVLPGNQLAYKNNRKMWAFYWTVLEFTSAGLSDEELASA